MLLKPHRTAQIPAPPPTKRLLRLSSILHLEKNSPLAHLFVSNIKPGNLEHLKMWFCPNQVSFILYSLCTHHPQQVTLNHTWVTVGDLQPSQVHAIPFFCPFSLYKFAFLYFQYFSLLLLHLPRCSLWFALTPLVGAVSFKTPEGNKNSCNAESHTHTHSPHANPAPNFKHPLP